MNEEWFQKKEEAAGDKAKSRGVKAPLQKVLDCGLTKGEENFSTKGQAKALCLISAGVLYDLLNAVGLATGAGRYIILTVRLPERS